MSTKGVCLSHLQWTMRIHMCDPYHRFPRIKIWCFELHGGPIIKLIWYEISLPWNGRKWSPLKPWIICNSKVPASCEGQTTSLLQDAEKIQEKKQLFKVGARKSMIHSKHQTFWGSSNREIQKSCISCSFLCLSNSLCLMSQTNSLTKLPISALCRLRPVLEKWS